MYIDPCRILNCFLCKCNIRVPFGKEHYITGQNISMFSKLACIENTLTNITGSCNNTCKCLCSKFKHR
ncbi:MAG: hypothetical protein RSB76_01825 [Clostridia bacterium]